MGEALVCLTLMERLKKALGLPGESQLAPRFTAASPTLERLDRAGRLSWKESAIETPCNIC